MMAAARPRRVPWWAWLLVSAGVIGLDQLSKWLVQRALALGESIRVLPFFDLVLVYNPGAAFSFLSSASGWQRHLFADGAARHRVGAGDLPDAAGAYERAWDGPGGDRLRASGRHASRRL